MREVLFTLEFHEQFRRLPLPIKKKFSKQLRLFRQNPLHPSLSTEKLNPKNRERWSFRVDLTYRVLFRFTEQDEALLLTIGHHGWIYRIR